MTDVVIYHENIYKRHKNIKQDKEKEYDETTSRYRTKQCLFRGTNYG